MSDTTSAESVPDPVDVALLAVEAWHADPGDGMPPHEVWWDSTKDAWFDGYEAGYKAALARIDGSGGER